MAVYQALTLKETSQKDNLKNYQMTYWLIL